MFIIDALYYNNIIKEVIFTVAYFISDDCISCGACMPECPVAAISKGDSKYIIDDNICIECGVCASVCPVNAPQPK